MDKKSKIQTIKEVYENQEFGDGGINETYKKANAIDPTIRRTDVKSYLDKLTHRQTQFQWTDLIGAPGPGGERGAPMGWVEIQASGTPQRRSPRG